MTDGLRLLTCYYRPKPGGLCRRLYRAMGALAERGHHVHYLAVEEFPLSHPHCHFHRLPLPTRRRSGALFWAWFGLLAPPALVWLGLRHRVAAGFAFGAFYGLMMQPLRLVRRLPLTVFLRADAVTNHRLAGRSWWVVALQRRVEAVGLAGARMLAVSHALAAAVRRRHPRLAAERVGVLPNDVPEVAGEPRPAAPPGRPLRVAAVGILEHRKNLGLLVEAMHGPETGSLRLTLYGTGPQASELARRIVDLGLEDRVGLAGWRRAEEIWPRVDLLLMPSRHEGAPNAVLEALARSIPVLASDVPEHREILPADSLLPVDDAAAWSARLAQVAADPARRLDELRRSQRPAADRLRFDWDAAVVAALTSGPAPAPPKPPMPLPLSGGG